MRNLQVDHPGDVATLRSAIPALARYSDVEIERYYEEYSRSFSAGWLWLDQDTIDDFRRWLEV